jgi:tetratricopeptide (TPR) repeat protein
MSRTPQARALYEQAMRDRASGNTVSAHMNLKLALSYDRTNSVIKSALRELATGAPTSDLERQAMDPEANKLLDEAVTAEAKGHIDEAVAILERALAISKDPALYNRLGVILAMRKRDVDRGRELVSKALEIDPSSKTYRHNLEKISQMRPTELAPAVSPGTPRVSPPRKTSPGAQALGKTADESAKPEKKGLFGLFSKKG